MKRELPKQLGVYSMAAGAVVIGASTTADAALQVYDFRSSILAPRVEYFAFDQTLIALNVKTGDFQYVYEVGHIADGVNEVERYNQDGFVDNNLIPDTDLTDDMVWFSHRDVKVPGKATADAVTFETPTGGAAGIYVEDGIVFSPQRVPGSPPATWSPHDWYWAEQTFDDDGNPGTPDVTQALPYPADLDAGDTPHTVTVDGSRTFNDSSPTGYTGVVTSGFGGAGHGNGSPFGVSPSTATIGFALEEADGTHYGWVAFRHNGDRVHQWVHGWAYQTTPEVPAELKWQSDSSGLPGDFDTDGDVDTDDIDILCDNLGNSAFDLDGDGDADEDDFVYLIETLVELTDGSGRVGTQVGDFNLDGLINATDLAIMNPNFGLGGMLYQNGNANCDDLINATDLAILAANFGYVAPAAAVPEPVTLSLLALGAGGVLANRRRR
ncbi:MAG: PEP-CTERM sorting domain-containing protein [Planctomycetota bacterium]|jgi:hypothetical protein